MFQCQTSWSRRSSNIKKNKKHTHTKGVEYISVTVFWCFVCRNPSEAGARRNTPKGEDKHPWRQLRFRVVAPLFITCPVCSVTAEGDGGKGRERGRERERELRENQTHRQRVACEFQSRGKDHCFFSLDWGPPVISLLGNEAIELKTSHEYSLKEKWLVLRYYFVYYSAS